MSSPFRCTWPSVWISALLLTLPGAGAAEAESCIPEKPLPPLALDYSTVAELCATGFGKEADLAPPTGVEWERGREAYAEKVQSFLRAFTYRDLGWKRDGRWRLTGEFAGCPEKGKASWTNEPHPLVRIYYSPEVMRWLCTYRNPEKASPAAVEEALPPGALIVKEMHTAEVEAGQPQLLAYRPGTGTDTSFGKLFVDADFDRKGITWTVMIKGVDTADGWYWGSFVQAPPASGADNGGPAAERQTFNPPIHGSSGFASRVDPATGYPIVEDPAGDPLPPPPANHWYPTFWGYSVPDVVYPNYGTGQYCIYCHGSAVSESTFSSLANLLGKEIEFDYLRDVPPAAAPTPVVSDHERGAARLEAAAAMPRDADGRAPFPGYDPLNLDIFERTFPQYAGLSFDEVWADRLPAQTWDHATADADGSEEFLTSDQCFACHGPGGPSQRTPNMVVIQDIEGGPQADLTPWAEWSASPMGLAGRDPIFYAMLESELNRAGREPGLEELLPCIQNTCLHCHGNMGQRQLALDTADQGAGPCSDFEPGTDPTSGGTWTPDEARAAGYGGQPFLRELMKAWPGDDIEHAKYGGLGRDGISCATCHRMAADDLGASGKTFTGNYRIGPPDRIFGPFDDNVRTEPMERSLGIVPGFGEHLTKSEMCGSCHAIYLPVFNNQGRPHPDKPARFEQTTYLEWLNSAFNEQNHNVPPRVWRSCQECHMRDSFDYHDRFGELATVSLDHERIANVEDETFPEADFRQRLDLEYRDYRRHTLYGLNVFLNAYFQQFPLLLGYRQQSYMDATPTAPLLTAREEALLVARRRTARVRIGAIEIDRDAGTLQAPVTVTNLAGHKLPSGVGFRRAFLEVVVLDGAGELLWASGLTSDAGVLQDGLTGRDLPSEMLEAAADTPCPQPYQPHYQTITEPCQVQIYEELTQDSDRRFTTSFIHRYYPVKDNRLLPRGYRTVSASDDQPGYCAPWCAEANPDGRAREDPDYRESGPLGGPGEDTVTYRVRLAPQAIERAATVRATFYSQATAPYFLAQRFDDGLAGPRSADSKRLYFLNSRLNTAARARDGEPYIDQYKLLLYRASAPVRPAG